MPAPVNRASVSFICEADQAMVQQLAQAKGCSISSVLGACISEYLQNNYHRLIDFYSSTPKLPPPSED